MVKTMSDYRILVIKVYEYFYREVTGFQDYEFTPSSSDENSITPFLEYAKEQCNGDIGVDFILNFFESGFNYWVEERKDTFKHSRYGMGSIKLSWIIGKKAIERYEKIKLKDNTSWPRFKRYIRRVVGTDVLAKFGIDRDAEVNKSGSFLLELRPVEENQKALYHNEEDGFAQCVTMTTLYNHKSKHCMLCKFSTDCKEMLRETYPKLYKNRGY